MRKVWVYIAMLVIAIAMVHAETCYTVLNTPTSNKYYWKAQTFDDISPRNTPYLKSTYSTSAIDGLDIGQQYNVRIDKPCFNTSLLYHIDGTGTKSSGLYIQNKGPDIYSPSAEKNSLYTISVKHSDNNAQTKIKNLVTNGVIDGHDYLKLPDLTSNKYKGFKNGLCNKEHTTAKQMHLILEKVWNNINYSESLNCQSEPNLPECIIKSNHGNERDYALLVGLLGRECGVPTRVVSGFSEGDFNGIDLEFNENKIHYWVEYFDHGWHTLESCDDCNSIPSNKEIQCYNNEDDDNDNAPDCKDEDCQGTLFCQGSYPTTTAFNNQPSTNLKALPNAYNIEHLRLVNNQGSVEWAGQSLDLRGTNIDNIVIIKKNLLNIKGPKLNYPATVVFKNLDMNKPKVFRNGQPCNKCNIQSNEDNIKFTIQGNGKYTIKGNKIFTSGPDNNTTQNNTNSGGTGNFPNSNNSVNNTGNNTSTIPTKLNTDNEYLQKGKNFASSTWDKFRALEFWKQVAIVLGIIGGLIFIKKWRDKRRFSFYGR